MPKFTVSPNVFDPTFRERVRDANPIERVVNDDLLAAGHHPLAGAGDELEGWHPAHGSTSGLSLKVNVTQGLWHCFNCGTGGDVFTWVMNARGYSFVEALHSLAARAGIPLPSLDPAQQQHWQQLQQERHDLEELFRAAMEFFHQRLTPLSRGCWRRCRASRLSRWCWPWPGALPRRSGPCSPFSVQGSGTMRGCCTSTGMERRGNGPGGRRWRADGRWE
jgi:hypothetical protein